MKKIVLITPAHPLRGGIAASSERLAQEFQTMGHNVVIYSFSLQYPGFLFPGTTQYTTDPPPPGLNIKTKVNSVWPLNWISVGLQLKKYNPDLIIVRYWLPFMGPCLGTILRVARIGGKVKIAALVDNAIPHEQRIGDKTFTRYFIGAVDGFVVMSRAVEQDIRQFTSQKPIVFNPHPIYDNYGEIVDKKTAREKLQLDPMGRYLLFFGFIRDYKGLDLLLKAMAASKIKEQKIKLIVAGEFYGKQDFYKDLIRDLEIGNEVVLHTHFIPSGMVRFYFGAADLVVQPYKTATQSGISQIAYHFEKPMVVTKVGGLPEIVPHGECGYVTEVNPAAVADAIWDFYHQDRETALITNVKQRKHQFAWKHLVDSFLRLFPS